MLKAIITVMINGCKLMLVTRERLDDTIDYHYNTTVKYDTLLYTPSGWRHRSVESSAPMGIHPWTVDSPHNSLLMRKRPNVIMWTVATPFTSSCWRYKIIMTSSNGNIFRVTVFVRGIHRSSVNSPHKGQWRGALTYSLICAWTQQLSRQWRRRWFETPSRSLWRHYIFFKDAKRRVKCFVNSDEVTKFCTHEIKSKTKTKMNTMEETAHQQHDV